MKRHYRPLAPICVFLVLLLASGVRATTFYWDANGGEDGTGGTGVWDTANSLWRAGGEGGSLGLYANAADDQAVFGGTAGTVTLNSDSVALNANRITFNTAGYTLAPPASGTATIALSGTSPRITSGVAAIISAPLSGGGALAKYGSGTLTLSGSNTYTGGTTLSEGYIEVSSLDNLGSSTSNLTFANNSIHVPALLRITGTSFTSLPNPIVLGTTGSNLYGGIEVVDSGLTVVASGDISGAGTLAKAGAGTLRLTGNNSSTGGIQMGKTSVSNGTLEFTSAAALGTGPIRGNYNASLSLKNLTGATATLGNAFNSVNNRYSIYFRGGDYVLNGTISGSAPYFYAETGLTVTINSPIATRMDLTNTAGTGSFILNPGPTSTTTIGTTTVPVGLGCDNALGGGTNSTNLYNGTNLFAPNGPVVIGTPVTLSCYSSDTLTFSGANNMTFTGALSYFNVNGGPILNVTGTGVATFASDFTHTGTGHRLRKSGTGVLALTGNNTTGWAMEVTDGALRAQPGTGLSPNSFLLLAGGVLEANGLFDYTLGTSGGGYLRWTNQWGGQTSGGFAAHGGPLTVDINGGGAGNLAWGSTANFIGTGQTFILGSATANDAVTFIDNINLGNSARTIQVNDNPGSGNDRAVISGSLTGSGSSGLIKTGDGLLELTGSNSYAGKTAVNAGVLRVGADGALGAAPGAAVADQLTLNGGTLNSNATFTLAATRGVTLGAGNGTILTDAGTTLTADGAVAGTGGLTKGGAGTLILTAANSYAGATGIGAGALLVNGTHTGGGAYTVEYGATFGGTGTIAASLPLPAVTVEGGGTLAPGASPGILTVTNAGAGEAVALLAGSTLLIEINGTAAGTEYDVLAVNGAISLDGATLDLSLGYSPALFDTFAIINNDGTDGVIGTFAGLDDGSQLLLGGKKAVISYFGDAAAPSLTGGNDVVLQVIPEPASLAMLAVAGLLALRRRR
ncbi:MAG: Autotransporter-associated beta strand repeat protein [Lentisphaerae bacterium ADurb.BinA184]|nr:MAG: Autotransporter-associated beta strand repeat protein [Lentisphaerae bacterium ADurb.BinA184]